MHREVKSGSYRRGRTHERGAVAIIVALTLAVLVAFVGLATDLGKLYVVKSELQNSADSCALAAARDLTGAINLSVSEASGITAGHLNYVLFQANPVQLVTNSSVTFSDALTNPFQPKSSVANPASIKYAQCTTALNNIANWFVQVLDVVPGLRVANASVSASAIATVGSAQTTCAIPVFVCKAGTQTSPPTAGQTYTIGQWIASKAGAPPQYGAGNFGWAALDGSNSANSIKSELTGNYCALPATGSSIGSPGNKAADSGAWNTRFGIYGSSYTQSGGTPDYTGYAYTATTWPAQSNAYGDFVSKRTTFTSYQGDGLPSPPNSGISTSGSASGTSYAAGADRRLALAPEVDCGQLLSGHSASVIQWDCVLMLDPMGSGGNPGPVHLEYRGGSTTAGNPCATQGVPGSSTAVGPQVPVLVQ